MRAILHRLRVLLLVWISVISLSACAGGKTSPAEEIQQAFADVRAEVQVTVDDAERADRAVEILNDMQSQFLAAQKRAAQHKVQLRALNANYDTSREEFDAGLQALLQDAKDNRQAVGKLRRQLLQQFTSSEWGEIEKARSKAVDAVFQVAGQS